MFNLIPQNEVAEFGAPAVSHLWTKLMELETTLPAGIAIDAELRAIEHAILRHEDGVLAAFAAENGNTKQNATRMVLSHMAITRRMAALAVRTPFAA